MTLNKALPSALAKLLIIVIIIFNFGDLAKIKIFISDTVSTGAAVFLSPLSALTSEYAFKNYDAVLKT